VCGVGRGGACGALGQGGWGGACTVDRLTHWTDCYKFWLRYHCIRDHPNLVLLNFVPAIITWQMNEQETGLTLMP
jgi:hypothetical protein